MNELAISISICGLFVIIVAWGNYLATIPSGKVPARPIGSILFQCIGITMAFSGIVWGYRISGSFSVTTLTPGLFALMMGFLFLWLLTLRKTPIGELKVKVGDQRLPFEAINSDGNRFHTDELAGKRILLKFFRGSW